MTFASLALAAVMGLAGQTFRVRPRPDLRLYVLCGFILVVHWSMFFQSVQASSVAVGLLSYSTFPVFTAALEPLAFRERWDLWNAVLSGVCVLGVALIVPFFALSDSVFRGVLWDLGAGLTFAVLSLLNRALTRRQPSLAVALYQDLFAGLFLAPFLLLSGFRLTGRTVALLVVMGIVFTAAAHALFIDGLKGVRARTASVISSLEPVYGVLLAFLFLKESPSLRTVSGGALILAAALLVTAWAGRQP